MFSSFNRSALVAFALAAASGLASDLSIKVSGPSTVASVDDFVVKTSLTNFGDREITLLNDPNSILTPDWKTATFGVINADGAPAKFGGVKVKWSPQLAAAHNKVTVIAPGQTIELEHNLSGVYNLTQTGPGAYKISAQNIFQEVTGAGELRSIVADVEPHSASFSGKLSSSKPIAPAVTGIRRRTVGYNGCSSSQQTGVNNGAAAAQTYVTNTISYLNTVSSATTRWTTWFGTYSSTYLSQIKSHYNNINGDPQSSTYDCTCTDADTYAYVYPDSPGYVYLCGAYWQAPTTGTDSKGGTIVHEQSHFTNNASTQDYEYGQTACKSLAKSNPSEARENADTHEYFAENNPAQS